MVLAWRNYLSDLGRAYPMLALSVVQVNDVPSPISPTDLLPPAIIFQIIEIANPCRIDGLTMRKVSLWLSDGAQFLVSYPQPFSDNLADYLTAQSEIAAWEFVGERIKYGRLRKLLDNV